MCVRLRVHIEDVCRSMAYKGRTSSGQRDTVQYEPCHGARDTLRARELACLRHGGDGVIYLLREGVY
jgi:hypothetical protein